MDDPSLLAEVDTAACDISLSVPVRVNRLASGDVIAASLGASLWRGSYQLPPARHVDVAGIEARLARLQRPGTSFLAWDTRRAGPAADPTGAQLAAFCGPAVLSPLPDALFDRNAVIDGEGLHGGDGVPELAPGQSFAPPPSVHSAGGNWLRIQGLPPGYVLRRGDWIGFFYGTSPTRRALHRVWSAEVVANAAGLTGQIEVEPLIRPGLVSGERVQLVRAACKAVLVGAAYGAGRLNITEGAQVAWTQTLR